MSATLTGVVTPGVRAALRGQEPTAEQVAAIVALACDPPADSDRPISQWTSRELADEIQNRGIVPTISARHAARLLKRGTSSRI